MNTILFFTYNLFTDQLDSIKFDHKIVISTLNPYSFLIAEKDKYFQAALLHSDILLPDGQGIIWAVKLLYGKTIKKIAGYNLFEYLVSKLNEHAGRCFFLGSTNETLDKIKVKLNNQYPQIKIQTYSPPFKPVFEEEENKVMIEKINLFNPDVLFVGMTAPKQEKWVYENKDKLSVNVIASIGAVFDFYSGNIKRPSQFWIDLGMEWFIRFLQEPKRLFKRNMYSILFVIKIIKLKYF